MIRRAKALLGTYVEIGVKTSATLDHEMVLTAIGRAFSQIETVHQLLSFHNATSELSQLNANPHCWFTLNRHSINVLRLARRMGKLSQNKFNCTLGGALVMRKILPQLVTHQFLDCGVAHDIEIRGTQVRINKPILISLDGIAKGYAVDLAVKQLLSDQIPAGWVNAGGDLRVFGDCSLKLHQRKNHALSEPKVFCNIAIASSRIARKCSAEYAAMVFNGQHESAIPAAISDDEQIISVAAKEAWRADALTKVAANLVEAERADWMMRLGGRYVQFGH